MKSIRLFFVVQILVMMTGCRSVETSRQVDAENTGTPPPPMVKQQATIKPNASFVSGIINSLEFIDSLHYRLSIQVNSSLSKGSMVSFAEPGQEVVVVPQFVLDAKGSIDSTNERNMRMLEVRHSKSGDMFIGKISLTAKGKWVIVDVESNQR